MWGGVGVGGGVWVGVLVGGGKGVDVGVDDSIGIPEGVARGEVTITNGGTLGEPVTAKATICGVGVAVT